MSISGGGGATSGGACSGVGGASGCGVVAMIFSSATPTRGCAGSCSLFRLLAQILPLFSWLELNRGAMVIRKWIDGVAMAALVLASVSPAAAQSAAPAPQQDSATPPAALPPAAADEEAVSVDLLTAIPDQAAVVMPVLTFSATPEIEAVYDKYYYFHRADTNFTTALADIRECDAFARGLTTGMGYTSTPYPYAGTMAGAVGGAIANVMVMMIFGSAEKRKLRRTNMRRCMHYKGYERYGLKRDLWEKFNFEEGLSSVKEVDRQRYLAQQAKVASTPGLAQKDLGL
jgi:hypothetical protein